jgi:hypothetical protein
LEAGFSKPVSMSDERVVDDVNKGLDEYEN